SGSLGIDLATTVEETLIDRTVKLLSTGVYGPIKINGKSVGALLLGRSSAAIKGLTIVRGVTDADFTGEIKIMAKMDFSPLVIPQHSRIAQLVPLPQLLTGDPNNRRGEAGFGSTGDLALFSVALNSRPELLITITYRQQSLRVMALLDSGADITIFA
ncbi:POK9 protein, partial [Mionectes macconnelli]|nr:POK9 protein [Mionectes macconnelli]